MTKLSELLARWDSGEGKPYKGSLIDWKAYKADSNDIGCMCAQGQVLHMLGDWSATRLLDANQEEADLATAKLLNISRTHAVLLRQINDGVNGAPSIVLTNPEKVIGNQWSKLLDFWWHVDGVDAEDRATAKAVAAKAATAREATAREAATREAAAKAAAKYAAAAREATKATATWTAARKATAEAATAKAAAQNAAAKYVAAQDAAEYAAQDAAAKYATWTVAREATAKATVTWTAAKAATARNAAAKAAAQNAVENAVENAVWATARAAIGSATWEIQGAEIFEADKRPFFFLPLFGFTTPADIPARPANYGVWED